MAEISGIEHVNITVRDVLASAAWYMELLDLERVWEDGEELDVSGRAAAAAEQG